MTSNLGTEEYQQSDIGFQHNKDTLEKKIKTSVENALKRTFRPELLNRIDDVIIFKPLTQENLNRIVGLLIQEVETRLAERSITIDISTEAKEWLVKKGYDPVFGARPLRRAIQRYIENPLSNKILQGDFKEGDHVIIEAKGDDLDINTIPE